MFAMALYNLVDIFWLTRLDPQAVAALTVCFPIQIIFGAIGVGTGVGCLNSYRSSGYGRLPKLNTLEAFDQNGWLLIAAETGILALVFFVQGIVHYAQLGYRQIRVGHDESNTGRWRCATAALAGLVGASVANVFSSVHFNGNITVFVLLLAMIPAIANLPRER
jgi:Na+-driven multidrug efflux pump